MNNKAFYLGILLATAFFYPGLAHGMDAIVAPTGTAASVLTTGANLDVLGDKSSAEPWTADNLRNFSRGGDYYRARIISVSMTSVNIDQQTKQKTHYDIIINQGAYKGKIFAVEYWNGSLSFSPQANDKVIVYVEPGGLADNPKISIETPDRSLLVWITLGIMCLLGLLLAGLKGSKIFILPIIAAALVATAILPLYLDGWPIWGIAILTIIFFSTLQYVLEWPWEFPTHAAAIGSAITGSILWILDYLFIVYASFGTPSQTISRVFFTEHPEINPQGLILIIMCMVGFGSIVPLARSITGNMEVLHKSDPNMDYRKLFVTGVRFGATKTSLFAWPLFLVWFAASMPAWLARYTEQFTWLRFVNQTQVSETLLLPLPIIIAITAGVFINAWIGASWLKAQEKIIKPLRQDAQAHYPDNENVNHDL